MNNQRKQELIGIAQQWAHDQIDNWIAEDGAWDHMIGDDLTENEWEWIRDSLKFSITVEEVEDE